MENTLLSKKFIFALIAVIMGFILVVMKMVDPDMFFKFVEFVGAGYILGNGIDKINDTIDSVAMTKQRMIDIAKEDTEQ